MPNFNGGTPAQDDAFAGARFQRGQHIIPESAANSPHATVWEIDSIARSPGHEPRYYCRAPGFGQIGVYESDVTLTSKLISQFPPSRARWRQPDERTMNDNLPTYVPHSDILPQRMVRAEQEDQRAMVSFVQWCLDNERLISQGRSMGFRLGASLAVKDLIVLSCTDDPAKAARIVANLQPVEL